ncbi:hypothetical protein MTO96_024898 [Rhipicephalus appendiculatus]
MRKVTTCPDAPNNDRRRRRPPVDLLRPATVEFGSAKRTSTNFRAPPSFPAAHLNNASATRVRDVERWIDAARRNVRARRECPPTPEDLPAARPLRSRGPQSREAPLSFYSSSEISSLSLSTLRRHFCALAFERHFLFLCTPSHVTEQASLARTREPCAHGSR